MSLFSRLLSFLPHTQPRAAGAAIHTGRFVPRASRNAGALRDPIAGWRGPRALTPAQAAQERKLSQCRTSDLAANDWAAASSLSAIIFNALGPGLLPDAAIPAAELGISRLEAKQLGKKFEWIFARWCNQADVTGQLHFQDLQMLGLRSILSQGEMLHLAVKGPGRFGLAIQALRPERLQTPADLATDPYVRDGIRFAPSGRPLSYYIANPPAGLQDSFANTEALTSADFAEIPYEKNGRRLVFHLFRHEEEEQTRGFSAFGPGIALFRNLTDTLNNELVSQMLATSLSVFIATETQGSEPLMGEKKQEKDGEKYQQIESGQVYYGAENEKPYVLENNRPSANFANFVEIILRAMAASQGIPYETLAKDYSKTNYSSMRAALNEAWKLYNFLRQWFARNYCQPIWEMALEDAWLQGMFELPKGAPDFGACRDLWCNAEWYGPARGFVDPVKETQATLLALQNGLMTWAEAVSERGHDPDEMLEKLAEEKAALEPLGLWSGGKQASSQPIEEDQDEEENVRK